MTTRETTPTRQATPTETDAAEHQRSREPEPPITATDWHIERLDLDGYLARLGIPARPPSREALDELLEAHVRTFTFDNIDVLLKQHPGVDIAAVNEKFVGRGRGGYCFEHSTIVAAALERLGYDIERRLGRVGDPEKGTQHGRTHLTIEVRLDGERLLCDPGFGMSVLRSIPLVHDARDDYLGWHYRVRGTADGAWALERRRGDGWEVGHITDEVAVLPIDLLIGHHFTSTFPRSNFRTGLMICKHLPGRHVTVTHEALTIRRAGQPTEHRPLQPGELAHWLKEMAVPLTADEQRRLSTHAP